MVLIVLLIVIGWLVVVFFVWMIRLVLVVFI